MADRIARIKAEQKLLKYLQAEAEPEEKRRIEKIQKEQKRREKLSAKANQSAIPASLESSSLSLDNYINTPYRVSNLILDSSFKTLNYGDNDFVLKLSDPLKNVAAIRILRTEFYNSSNLNTFENNFENVYLYLNGYINTFLANNTNTQIYGRLIAGTETYPSVSGDIKQDPYIYFFRPIENSLNRFHIKLLNSDGSLYDLKGNKAKIVITFAIYSVMNLSS